MKLLEYYIQDKLIGKSDLVHACSGAGWNQKQSTIDQFLDYATVTGCALLPALLSHSGKSYTQLRGFDLFVVDVDNDGGNVLTIPQALEHPFIKANAFALWTSTNHLRQSNSNPNGELHKYRVGFVLKKSWRFPAGDQAEIQRAKDIYKQLCRIIPGSDTNYRPINYIAGCPGAEVHWVDRQNVLDHDQLEIDQPPQRVSFGDGSRHHEFDQDLPKLPTEQSVNNLQDMLSYIDSSDYNNWLTVGGCIKNISEDVGGEDAALDIYLEWCQKDYPEYNEQECTHMFLHNFEQGIGGWLRLKELASDAGRETYTHEFENPLDLVVSSNGFDVQQHQVEVDANKSALDEMPSAHELEMIHLRLMEEPKQRQARVMLEELLVEPKKIRLNELTRTIEILGEPMTAAQFSTCEHWLDKNFGLCVGPNTAKQAIQFAADQNPYHPIKDYLNYVHGSVQPCDIDQVVARVLGIDDPLSLKMVKCWLVGAVSKVMQKGSDFIEVLCLVNPRQGIGKSEFFKTLASPDWFSDSFDKADNDKDRLMILHSAWINELSELDNISTKKEIRSLKSLISSTHDDIRLPYGPKVESQARRFVIGATSNEGELFGLDDEQRRIWAIEVRPTTTCNRLDIMHLRENRDALWSAAMQLWKQQGDAAYKMTTEERAQVIKRNQGEFRKCGLNDDLILDFLLKHDVKAITTRECLVDVLSIDRPTRSQEMQMSGLLRSAGYERKKNRKKHGVMYASVYVRDDRSYEFNPKTVVHPTVDVADDTSDF